jgi:hypothetical protein
MKIPQPEHTKTPARYVRVHTQALHSNKRRGLPAKTSTATRRRVCAGTLRPLQTRFAVGHARRAGLGSGRDAVAVFGARLYGPGTQRPGMHTEETPPRCYVQVHTHAWTSNRRRRRRRAGLHSGMVSVAGFGARSFLPDSQGVEAWYAMTELTQAYPAHYLPSAIPVPPRPGRTSQNHAHFG